MKNSFLTLYICLLAVQALAQKHSLYADIGTMPGFSATYNYRVAKWLGVGAGLQGNKIYRTDSDTKDFTPSLYANIRLNAWCQKKNQFFTALDLGMNIFKQDKSFERDSTSVYHFSHNNGFYTGLGLGYFRRMTNRGGGPYLSLKLITNWYTLWGYSIVAENQDIGLMALSGTLGLTLGFKF